MRIARASRKRQYGTSAAGDNVKHSSPSGIFIAIDALGNIDEQHCRHAWFEADQINSGGKLNDIT
jgi:hypothetical protein